MAVDWLKIKTEYINDQNASYRKLADKYGVNKDTIAVRAKNENWKALRDKQTDDIQAKTIQKTAEKIAEKESDRITRMLSLTDELVDKIERSIQEVDRTYATNKKKTKVIEYNNDRASNKATKETVFEQEEIVAISSIVDRKGLQQIATAMKAVWDILGDELANKPPEMDDDGLLDALGKNATSLFDDGDDSGMLPDEEDDE